MIFYFISGALNNFRTGTTAQEKTGIFSTPLFQDDVQKTNSDTSPIGTSGSNSQQRSTSTTSNTTTTKETTNDQTNNTTTPGGDNSFVEDTTETVNNTANDVNPPSNNILDPVITQGAGVLNNLFGN